MKKLFRKDDDAVSPVIAVILMVAITVVLAGVLYVWVSGFGGGGGGGVSISSSVTDKSQYWKVDIVKVSGGSLSLSDAKFLMISSAGIQVFKRTINDANPTSLTSGDSTAYPIPSSAAAVNENASAGDGATVDAASLAKPQVWENCYMCYLDSNSDGKVSAGDALWVYKDYNADGTEDFTTGYRVKILDGSDNEVLTKEF